MNLPDEIKVTIPAFDTALEHLKNSEDPIGEIFRTSAYLFPMQWLYCQMIKQIVNEETKERALKPLGQTDEATRNKYWSLVKYKDWSRSRKIWAMQAVYVWENLY